MPTIKRTITEIVRKDVKAEWGTLCCDGIKASNKNDYGVKLYNGDITIGGKGMSFCPFCGEKVIYDDTVILPEGYMKKGEINGHR